MALRLIIKRLPAANVRSRYFSTAVSKLQNQKSEESSPTKPGLQGGTTKLTSSDKWIVKNFGQPGKYASTQDVPNEVRSPELDRARSKARIFISSFAIACLIVCCGISVYYGKHLVEQGDNVHNRNMARHSRELAPSQRSQ